MRKHSWPSPWAALRIRIADWEQTDFGHNPGTQKVERMQPQTILFVFFVFLVVSLCFL